MPEESFEQQARRRAEEFSMEPTPKVWQRVEASITPKERRGRILFWWWLLPLCLAGGMAAWVVKSRMAVTPETVTIGGNGIKKEDKALKFQVEKKDGKTDNAETLVDSNVDEQREQGLKETSQHETGIALADKFKYKRRGIVKISSGFTANEDEGSNEAGPKGKTDPIINREEKPLLAGEDLILQNNAPEQVLQYQLPDSSSTATGNGFIQNEESKPDTASVVINHSLPGNTVAVITEKKKTEAQGNSWQAGVMAEAGLVSWMKGWLGNKSNSPGAFTSLPSNGASNDSFVSTGTAFHQTKNGVSAGLGILVRKPLSDRFYFAAQFGYRYQQYKVYRFVRALIPQPIGSTFSSISSDNYHAQFLNLGLYAGLKLLTGRRNALSAEAGIDNSFLFVAQTQKDDSTQSARVDRNNITANFYKWQPQLSAALPFDWHKADKTKFQIAPFARLGLHTFQKNGNPYKNNHLVSAGIQLIYFFK